MDDPAAILLAFLTHRADARHVARFDPVALLEALQRHAPAGPWTRDRLLEALVWLEAEHLVRPVRLRRRAARWVYRVGGPRQLKRRTRRAAPGRKALERARPVPAPPPTRSPSPPEYREPRRKLRRLDDLTEAEEADAVAFAQAGDQVAMAFLARLWSPLVRSLAQRSTSRGVPREDLEQEGHLAALEAVQKHDAKVGRLGAWLLRCVSNRLVDAGSAQRTTIKVPRHTQKRRQVAEEARDTLEMRLGRRAGREEIAGELGWTPDEVGAVLDLLPLAVLESAQDEGEPAWPEPAVVVNPAEGLERLALGEILSGTLPKRLEPEDETLLRELFGLGGEPQVTLTEAAERHGWTRQKAHERLGNALDTLRRPDVLDALGDWMAEGS